CQSSALPTELQARSQRRVYRTQARCSRRALRSLARRGATEPPRKLHVLTNSPTGGTLRCNAADQAHPGGMPMRRQTSLVLAGAVAARLVLRTGPAALAAAAGPTDPVPIPGGIQIPGGPLIHVFAPGPEDQGFMGLDTEPNTITNFDGFSAMAYVAGTATD